MCVPYIKYINTYNVQCSTKHLLLLSTVGTTCQNRQTDTTIPRRRRRRAMSARSRRRSSSPLTSFLAKLSTVSTITLLLLCIAFISVLALAFALPESDQQLDGGGSSRGNASELSSGPRSRPKEDSFADMIDRALEKEFTENDQTEGLFPLDLNSSQLILYFGLFCCSSSCTKKIIIWSVELATGNIR